MVLPLIDTFARNLHEVDIIFCVLLPTFLLLSEVIEISYSDLVIYLQSFTRSV